MSAHVFVHHRCPSLFFSTRPITEPGVHYLASKLQESSCICLAPSEFIRSHCFCWLLGERMGWGWVSKLRSLCLSGKDFTNWPISPALVKLLFFFFFKSAWIKALSFVLSSLLANSPTSLLHLLLKLDSLLHRYYERQADGEVLKNHPSRMPGTPSSPAVMFIMLSQ